MDEGSKFLGLSKGDEHAGFQLATDVVGPTDTCETGRTRDGSPAPDRALGFRSTRDDGPVGGHSVQLNSPTV